MSSTFYKAGLIGLGQIAAGYSSPTDVAPYCHAGGIMRSGRFELVGAADIFEQARERFHTNWGEVFPRVQLSSDVEQMLATTPLDVVAVCVRGPHHLAVMRQVLAARPRAIFLEKPPTCSLAEMDELMNLSRELGIPIVVSYSRHWDLRVQEMEKRVREGLIGRVHTVVGYCGGPILSYASHTTDLICQFAGAQSGSYSPQSVTARGFVPSAPSDEVPPDVRAQGYEVEPHLKHLQIHFEDGVLGVQIGGRGEAGEFYADVWGDEGRIRVGMYCEPQAFDLKDNPLDLSISEWPSDQGPFTQAYTQIAHYLDGGPIPDCTNDKFVTVHEIGFGAIESLLNEGRPVQLPNVHRSRKIYANS